MPSIAGPTRVEHSESLGKVLVASKSFEVGEHVLVETPLVSWASGENHVTAYLDTLSECDEATRAAVLEMYHPALDSDDECVRELRAAAEGWLGAGERPGYMTLDYVRGALLVKKLNAHSYENATRIALFEVGSKAAHSCNPNCAYSSRDVRGHLVVKAIRPISAGDHITISYIGDVFLKTTAERREELMETKLFTCMCARCLAPDPLRAMPCVVDDAHVMCMECFPSPDNENMWVQQWRCTRASCRASPEGEESLNMLVLEEKAVQAKLQHNAGTAFIEESIEEPQAVKDVIGLVPRTNATNIRAHLLLSQILRSRAEDAENMRDGAQAGNKQLRLRAAEEAVNACSIIECVAAGRIDEEEDSNNYSNSSTSPVYQCCPHILAAAKDIHLAASDKNNTIISHKHHTVINIAKHIIRYIPCMTTMWPAMAEDSDMMRKFQDFKTWVADQ